jgi:hypothetical protein
MFGVVVVNRRGGLGSGLDAVQRLEQDSWTSKATCNGFHVCQITLQHIVRVFFWLGR